MNDTELIAMIDAQRDLMIAVATGGPRIDDVNREYIDRRSLIRRELRLRGISDPNPHADLWAWYGRWSAGDMPRWALRREYVAAIYHTTLEQLRSSAESSATEVFDAPTGWGRVDRNVYEVRRHLEQASTEEQCQAVGLLCRETLISLAQIVYDSERHAPVDGVDPSSTDAARMLEGFISVELAGGHNESVRRHAKAALSLANALQHDRTADYRLAALCAEATTSVVNIIAVISGVRDRLQ